MSDYSILKELAQSCKAASRIVAQLSTGKKNTVLLTMADQLLTDEDFIISANSKDVKSARENGLSDAMLDRLVIDHGRLLLAPR